MTQKFLKYSKKFVLKKFLIFLSFHACFNNHIKHTTDFCKRFYYEADFKITLEANLSLTCTPKHHKHGMRIPQ